MRCRACSATIADGARFCHACGARVLASRRTVGDAPGNGESARRAAAAASSSPPVPPAPASPPDHADAAASGIGGDRRIVTALFADLVDYVRLVAEHDAEEVRRRVDAALGARVDAIQRFDGTPVKFIGVRRLRLARRA